MLNTSQRSMLFYLFFAIVICGVLVEMYMVYAFVEKGFTITKAVVSFLAGSVIVGVGRLFLQLLSKAFLKPSITSDRLHRFASDRSRIVDEVARLGLTEDVRRQRLIISTLKFAEESLRGWVPGSHLELCVFVDHQQPLLFAYFDTNHDTNARSMAEREHNPNYYVENKYEVIKLLKQPTSQPQVIDDTESKAAKYAFASKAQRKQLKSSVLLCIDIASPCALVVTSNERRAFPEADAEVISFIKYIAQMVRFDLFDGNFVGRIRELIPGLFTAA